MSAGSLKDSVEGVGAEQRGYGEAHRRLRRHCAQQGDTASQPGGHDQGDKRGKAQGHLLMARQVIEDLLGE